MFGQVTRLPAFPGLPPHPQASIPVELTVRKEVKHGCCSTHLPLLIHRRESGKGTDIHSRRCCPCFIELVSTLKRFEGYCEGKIKRLMLNLRRPEQQQYVDMERSPLILLKGSAGSGKTTVGIYRAIRLAEQGRRVLVLTFNRTLSSVTKALIEELIGPLPRNLHVMTLHRLMHQFLHTCSIELHIADDGMLRKFLNDALHEIRLKDNAMVLQRDQTFFEEEIKRVIKGLGMKNLEEYKAVERYGRKTALSPKQREAVWKVYEAYQRRMLHARLHDWADHAAITLETLQDQPVASGFDDIIVDEAQDLRPVDLRVIQQFVAPSPAKPEGAVHSVMILADAAQTLYSRGLNGHSARDHPPYWLRRPMPMVSLSW
jgi:superfamily I DNA/RNA helicase